MSGYCFEHSSATTAAPDKLSQVLDELEAEKALREAIGETLVDKQIFMKRAEVKKTAKFEGETLRDFYITYIEAIKIISSVPPFGIHVQNRNAHK